MEGRGWEREKWGVLLRGTLWSDENVLEADGGSVAHCEYPE
jgi:hypothetical protein